jgi:uncharacterized protein (TIGR02118 family)
LVFLLQVSRTRTAEIDTVGFPNPPSPVIDSPRHPTPPKQVKNMIKLSVLYPNTEGSTFDITYYCDKHMSLVRQRLGPALKSVSVDQGIGGARPGAPPPYLAIGHLFFDSLDVFLAAFPQHMDAFKADIPNYTNSVPVILLSEVKM